MRESIGTAWLYGLVITFILLFTTFLTLIIDYSGVYMYKNDVIEIIEKYEGYTANSKPIINAYLSNSGYKTTGTCPSDYYGATSLTGDIEKDASKSYYCIKENNNKIELIMFFNFNLPVIGNLITFNITGQTDVIKYLSTSGL